MTSREPFTHEVVITWKVCAANIDAAWNLADEFLRTADVTAIGGDAVHQDTDVRRLVHPANSPADGADRRV